MAHQRNGTLDLLKLLASYMVVFIHVLFYGKVGDVVDALARFAVPLFFAVSGFYSYEITPKQIKKRISHILRLIGLAVTVYVLWQVLPFILLQNTQELAKYFGRFLGIERLLRLLVFNMPIYNPHLWYLFEILYVYIIYYFVTVFKVRKWIIYVTSILLLVLHIFLGEILSLFKIDVSVRFVRNFALMGIPFFGLGLLLKSYERKLLNTPNYVIVILLVIGFLETILSRFFVDKNELYIGSLFLLLAIVIIFTKYPNIEYPPVLLSLASCSTYIYIFHPLVSEVILYGYSAFFDMDYNTSVFLQMVHPLFVCMMTTLLSYILCKAASRSKA